MAVDEARAARIRAYAERHPTDTGNITALGAPVLGRGGEGGAREPKRTAGSVTMILYHFSTVARFLVPGKSKYRVPTFREYHGP